MSVILKQFKLAAFDMAKYDSDGSGGVVSDGIKQTNIMYEV